VIREEDEKRELKQQQKTTNQNSSGCTINRRDCVYDIVPFSSGTSDAGIKAEPTRLSAVIAKNQRFLSYRRYLHRTYRLFQIVNNVRYDFERFSKPFEVVRTHNT